jgi:hypothetical protein
VIKIKALHSFLVGLDLFAAEQMDSCVDMLTITPACRPHVVAGQLVAAEMDYTATFNIARYPHSEVPPELLFAQMSVWALQNDPNRLEPLFFEINIDVLDTQTADIEFAIKFNELVLMKEHVGGGIVFKDRAYVLA